MSAATETLLALANYNSWRRGDETLEMPSPAEIGATIDDAVNLLREYDELERRAERAESELAAERARLDYIDSLSPGDAWGIYRSSAQQNANLHAGDPRTLRKLPGIRAAIDAAMKEETK